MVRYGGHCGGRPGGLRAPESGCTHGRVGPGGFFTLPGGNSGKHHRPVPAIAEAYTGGRHHPDQRLRSPEESSCLPGTEKGAGPAAAGPVPGEAEGTGGLRRAKGSGPKGSRRDGKRSFFERHNPKRSSPGKREFRGRPLLGKRYRNAARNGTCNAIRNAACNAVWRRAPKPRCQRIRRGWNHSL